MDSWKSIEKQGESGKDAEASLGVKRQGQGSRLYRTPEMNGRYCSLLFCIKVVQVGPPPCSHPFGQAVNILFIYNRILPIISASKALQRSYLKLFKL